MKRTIALCAVGVLMLDGVAIAASRQDATITVELPFIDAAPQTVQAEIMTGVCTFGDCPVAMTETEPATSPETEPATEPITAPETVTITPEVPEEPVWQGDRTVTCWVTAYCGCENCSEGWGSMTATGGYARPNHTIAVDPSVIPYGTRVEINGTVYTAEDCGEAVNGYEIDVYFDSHWQTEAFATGYYQVTLL